VTRTWLLWLHIAGVAAWLGANFVQLALAPRFTKESAEAQSVWTRQQMWLGTAYYGPVGALIAITGVLLVWHGHWSWGAGFVWVGISVVVIGAVLGVAAFTPMMQRRVDALERGDTAAAGAALDRVLGLAALDTVLVLTAVLAMVHKWQA